MVKKLVMFDFDGVLANTIQRSFDLHKEINPDLTWQKFKDFSNGNFLAGMGKAVEAGLHVIPKDFFAHYDKHISNETLQEELRNAIVDLSRNYILSIVSSTRDISISAFLKKEKISEYFSDILGTDAHASKVVKIKSLLEKHDMSPKDAIFVTDTLGDIREAEECGVISIGVLWGLHEKENLEKGNPVKILNHPSELLSTISEVLR